MGNLKIQNNPEEHIVNKIQKQIENLYENLRGAWPHGSSYFSSPLKMLISPRINITENKSQYIIAAELPGVEKSDIKLNIEDDNLTISTEKKYIKTDEEENFYHVEHGYGSIQRTIKIPSHIDKESIEASFQNGLLEIKVNKLESPNNKKSINIA